MQIMKNNKIDKPQNTKGNQIMPVIVIFTSSKVRRKYDFFHFWKISEGCIFASRTEKVKYEFKPHNIIYQVKGLSSHFSKISKTIEVGQLHAFGGFLTEKIRENAKYAIRKKIPNSFSEVAQLQN